MNILLSKSLAGFLALGMVLFASCKDDDPVRAREAAVGSLFKDGVVKIAVARSFAMEETGMLNGAILAQERIENSEEFPFKIELVQFDDGGTVASATKKAYELISDNEICAVIGHAYSDITLDCSLVYQYYGVLLFNCISTAHKLTQRRNPLIVTNMPDDSDFGDTVAKLCVANNYDKILVYYLRSVWGAALTGDVEASCAKNDIMVVSTESFEADMTDSENRRIVNRWRNNFSFDAVFLAGRMPGIPLVVKAMRDVGVNCPIIGTDTFDEESFAKALSSTENKKVFAVSNNNPKDDRPQYRDFCSAFTEKFGKEPDQEALQAYDALMVLARGIAEANSAIPADIANTLKDHEWDEAAGPYYIDKNGKVHNKELTTKVFKNGKFENY